MTLPTISSGRGAAFRSKGEQFYGQALGGDYRYDLLTLDGKFFLPLTPSWTLSLAGNYQTLSQQDNHLTPMARPYIDLRGISRCRYTRNGRQYRSDAACLASDAALDFAGVYRRWKCSKQQR